MIENFYLAPTLWMYGTGQLPEQFVDPVGIKHYDAWKKFAIEMFRINNNSGHRQHFGFVDRTGAIPSIVKTQPVPIPSGLPAYSNYLELCQARAKELLATGKHINVMWSGGIDSTVALFALVDQSRNLDQISVVCTLESVIESGRMFDQHIKPLGIRIKFDQTRLNKDSVYTYDNEDPTQLYITGQCGDQLFGPRIALSSPLNTNSDPWHQGYDKNFLDIIEPSMQFSARPIETVRDLKWWVFFNYIWSTVRADDRIQRPAHLAPRIQSFFDTNEFQRWAITTPTYHENPNQYRWPAKQALATLIDYPYYTQHKKKSNSYTWVNADGWYMMDQDYNNYFKG